MRPFAFLRRFLNDWRANPSEPGAVAPELPEAGVSFDDRVAGISASGDRSVSIGTGVERAIIFTGDVHLGNGKAGASSERGVFNLPARARDFTGRADELDRITRTLISRDGRATISVISGMGGLGKTTLALEAAWWVAEQFRDGVLFVDLLGFRQAPMPTEQALRQILWAFDPLADLGEERSQLLALYRQTLAGKQLLLIFDNARDPAHFADLLPPEPVTALVTSRRRTTLQGAIPIELDVLPKSEAIELLAKITESIDHNRLGQLATTCGCLPLALRAAGSYLRVTGCPIDDYLADLADARLELLSADRDPDDELNVEAVLAFSLDRLLEEDRELAACYVGLSVFQADFDLAAVAAVWQLDERSARRSVDRLVARSLVERDTRSGRFHLHDLLHDLVVARMVASL